MLIDPVGNPAHGPSFGAVPGNARRRSSPSGLRPGHPVGSGLGELVDGDLKWSIDVRRVYATLLDQWLGLPAETVLGQRFENLPLLEV
jgi:hypothetical protein